MKGEGGQLKAYWHVGGEGGVGVQLEAYVRHTFFSQVRYKIKIKWATQTAKIMILTSPVQLKSANFLVFDSTLFDSFVQQFLSFIKMFVAHWLIVISKRYLVASSLENTMRALATGERGCRLKSYVHVQGRGRSGLKLQTLSVPTFWMTPAVNFIY